LFPFKQQQNPFFVFFNVTHEQVEEQASSTPSSLTPQYIYGTPFPPTLYPHLMSDFPNTAPAKVLRTQLKKISNNFPLVFLGFIILCFSSHCCNSCCIFQKPTSNIDGSSVHSRSPNARQQQQQQQNFFQQSAFPSPPLIPLNPFLGMLRSPMLPFNLWGVQDHYGYPGPLLL
jgi:hypothetical protein